jgi:hypothetical protein
MKRTIAVAFVGFAVVAATTAYGQEPGSPIVDESHVFGTGLSADGSAMDQPPSPLLTIGGLDVRVWAPMEPHYNGEANRDSAAEPLWGADAE